MDKRTSSGRIIFLGINLLIIILFLLVCLVPFVNSGTYWWIALPGLIFPYLLAVLIIFLIIHLLSLHRKSSKIMLVISLICLLLGFSQIRSAIAFHFSHTWESLKKPGTFRVLNWNVNSWDVAAYEAKGGFTFQPLMYDFIEQQAADILCFQEFFNCIDPTILPSYVKELEARGYPHHYFAPASYTVNGKFQSGLAIFSKFPIIDTAYFTTVSNGHSEGYQYADIQTPKGTIRVFNTHLESVGFDRSDHEALGKIEGSRTILRKLINSYKVREIQAAQLKAEMNKSPHPIILCGDIDDIPNSHVYFLLRKSLSDPFLQKGLGLGSTYRFIAPNLRIDYILTDKKLKTIQWKNARNKYSDHDPIMADLSWGK